MKPKDCLLRFFHRIKTQLIKSVNVSSFSNDETTIKRILATLAYFNHLQDPFTLTVTKRLGHVAGLQEMEKSEPAAKDTDAMFTTECSDNHEIEFVEVENDLARVEPTTDTENQSEFNFFFHAH